LYFRYNSFAILHIICSYKTPPNGRTKKGFT